MGAILNVASSILVLNSQTLPSTSTASCHLGTETGHNLALGTSVSGATQNSHVVPPEDYDLPLPCCSACGNHIPHHLLCEAFKRSLVTLASGFSFSASSLLLELSHYVHSLNVSPLASELWEDGAHVKSTFLSAGSRVVPGP